MSNSKSAFWQDQCVLITGASSGIGWALATLLARQGAKVGLLARRQPLLDELAAAIRAEGGTVACAAADVTDLDGLRTAVQSLEKELGPCDVMVANAGIYRKTSGRDFDPATAEKVVAVNLLGVIHSLGVVLPGMVERGRGRLAAVSSAAGGLGLPGASAYSASKAGVTRFLESLRVDLAPLGIPVTAICPGFVDTPLLTVHERATLKEMVTADYAAARIARAIERGKCEDWFPWRTKALVRLSRLLPGRLFNRVMARYPEMEEPDA